MIPPTRPPKHLFLSHASEDWIFTDWLALKLASIGYCVWYDRMQLLGGESYPRDIDVALRERTFRLLAVLSKNSLTKPNPLKERTLALQLAKERDTDFLIPLKIEDFPTSDLGWQLSDIVYIPFDRSWKEGLTGLVKKLEAIDTPRDTPQMRSAVRATLDQGLATRNFRERLWTNLLPMVSIPSEIHHFFLKTSGDNGVLEIPPTYLDLGNGECVSFRQPAKDEIEGPDEEVDWNSATGDDRRRVVDWISGLIRLEVNARLRGLGLKLSGDGESLYFPDLAEGERRIDFSDYGGERSWVQATGERTFRRTGGFREVSRYHLSPDFKPVLSAYGSPYLRLTIGLYWTDNLGNPLPPRTAASHRRSLGSTWWNNHWLARVLACSSFLCGGDENFTLLDSKSGSLVIGARPLSLSSDIGIDEGQLSPVTDDSGTAELLEESEDLEDTEDL